MREHYKPARNKRLEVLNHPAGQNPMSSCPIGCTCATCTQNSSPKICDSCDAGHHEYCEEQRCKCEHPRYQGEMKEEY